MSLTQAQVYERINAEPNRERRLRMIRAWKIAYGGRTSEDGGAKRNIDERRKFHGDILRYARDIFGYTLYDDLEGLLYDLMTHRRILVPAANDLGKTFAITLWATYRYDVVGAMPDLEAGLEQQGCLVLMLGPSEPQIYATVYLGMVKHFERAVRRGHGMPGTWSQKTVRMVAGPQWYAEAVAPQVKAGEEIAHGASGRHHDTNQIAIMEEGQAVREPVWRAVEGGFVGENDTIASPFQPDVPIGPARDRAERGDWHVRHMSAMGHPNVIKRKIVIKGPISHGAFDDSVRHQCKDLGLASKRTPDPKYYDFVYALPPLKGGRADPAPRRDKFLGHIDGELHVFRPSTLFIAQRLGRWPIAGTAQLFSVEMLQESAARYDAGEDPDTPPDNVGLDPAQYGDDATAAPRWGKSSEEVLRGYHEAARKGAAAADAYRSNPENRIRVGMIRVMPKGDSAALANAVLEDFPDSPFVVDQGGGEGVISDLRNHHDASVLEIPFGGVPWEPIEGEQPGIDKRACMYIRASALLTYGLVDAAMPAKLKKDLLSHQVSEIVYRFAEVEMENGWERVKRACVRIIEKKKIKQVNGRSPDYSDAFVLSLVEPIAMERNVVGALVRVQSS